MAGRRLGSRLADTGEIADRDHFPSPKAEVPASALDHWWCSACAYPRDRHHHRVIGERNAPAESSEPATSPTQEALDEEPTPEPTQAEPTPTSAPGPALLTPESNPEFAAILALGDYCSPDIAAFAAAHSGEIIAFPGYIGAINPHDGATTRYDILIGAGDYSETSAPGPAFQFRDVNTTNDMRWVGDVSDSVAVGTNLTVTAEVDRYEESSCLFLIEPVSTAVR